MIIVLKIKNKQILKKKFNVFILLIFRNKFNKF